MTNQPSDNRERLIIERWKIAHRLLNHYARLAREAGEDTDSKEYYRSLGRRAKAPYQRLSDQLKGLGYF